MAEPANAPWPTEIRVLAAERRLEVDWEGGTTFSYPAELLRVETPSAEVQGHGPGQKVTLPGKRHVGLSRAEPVGNYAVRLHFDDGHATGLYTWPWLWRLGREQDRVWLDYLAALERQGLRR